MPKGTPSLISDPVLISHGHYLIRDIYVLIWIQDLRTCHLALYTDLTTFVCSQSSLTTAGLNRDHLFTTKVACAELELSAWASILIMGWETYHRRTWPTIQILFPVPFVRSSQSNDLVPLMKPVSARLTD